MNDASSQESLCQRYCADFLPPAAGSRVGIAIATLQLKPLNGMRIEPRGDVCGWNLWGGGELSNRDDFFQPLCVEHLTSHCPAAIPFLALPPGWRFMTDGESVHVWFDADLR